LIIYNYINLFNNIDIILIFINIKKCVFKAKMKQREEKRKEEKRLKKKLDMFKYALKKVTPPITIHSTWEEVLFNILYD